MALTAETELLSETEWLELIGRLSLSPRQAQIIKCLFSGLSDKQIAAKLQISLPTVRTYLNRLFSRFNVQGRTELVLYVFRHLCLGCRLNGCKH